MSPSEQTSPDTTTPVMGDADPAFIRNYRFATAFRGYDTAEVREFLNRVADSVASYSKNASDYVLSITSSLSAPSDLVEQSGTDADAVAAPAAEHERRALAEAEAIVASARNEAHAIVAKANDDAARIILRARAESRGKPSADTIAAVEAAFAESPSDPLLAKEQARIMITEAKAVRERILTDLAKRRRVAHVQLEQLRVAREKLLESFRDARRVADDASRDLSTAEVEARLAAETAGRRVGTEALPSVAELEAELFSGRSMLESTLLTPSTAPADSVPRADTAPHVGNVSDPLDAEMSFEHAIPNDPPRLDGNSAPQAEVDVVVVASTVDEVQVLDLVRDEPPFVGRSSVDEGTTEDVTTEDVTTEDVTTDHVTIQELPVNAEEGQVTDADAVVEAVVEAVADAVAEMKDGDGPSGTPAEAPDDPNPTNGNAAAATSGATSGRLANVDDLFARLRAEREQAAANAHVYLGGSEGSSAASTKRTKSGPRGGTAMVDTVVIDLTVAEFDSPLITPNADTFAVSAAVVADGVGTSLEHFVESDALIDLESFGGESAIPFRSVAAVQVAPEESEQFAFVTGALQSQCVRAIKRFLQDEQSSVLSALRTARNRVAVDDLLGAPTSQIQTFADAISVFGIDAYRAGVDGANRPLDIIAVSTTLRRLADDLATLIAGDIRTGIARSLEAESEKQLLSQEIADLYRTWSSDRIAALASESLRQAFMLGWNL